MPESKGRPKPAYTPPRTAQSHATKPNPPWFVPVMIGLMLIGLVWVVTYYISGAHEYPVPAIGRWNLGAGFGFMMAGFLMTTRWR
ncbi:cell division protein CrgA [Knoellia sp. Soil729]|uniref:cell division protein CrgA n=1 Tax=Knoellia sp. Soil729 TaxID=1736394 RepID=UPI000701234F|nr:cell division protein CrgA [Knoellia sp. Soil729]KRE42819.1 septation inhibitor protein [Knoellia sp. Soil729]